MSFPKLIFFLLCLYSNAVDLKKDSVFRSEFTRNKVLKYKKFIDFQYKSMSFYQRIKDRSFAEMKRQNSSDSSIITSFLVANLYTKFSYDKYLHLLNSNGELQAIKKEFDIRNNDSYTCAVYKNNKRIKNYDRRKLQKVETFHQDNIKAMLYLSRVNVMYENDNFLYLGIRKVTNTPDEDDIKKNQALLLYFVQQKIL